MAASEPRVTISAHARSQALRRGLDIGLITTVAQSPEQRLQVRVGREVRQSRVTLNGKLYLMRVVVDMSTEWQEIVTVYRTSKVEKYWSR